MKDKMKRRVEIRHEVSDHGKVDRVVLKSYTKETSHKIESSSWGDGFVSSIMKAIDKILGFFRPRKQIEHNGVSTKSYCSKFGGASGGSTKNRKYSNKGRPGVKLAKKLTVHIPSKGII